MNDIALLAEYGPEAEPLTPGVLADARLQLLASIDHPRKVRTIRRPAIRFALAGGVAAAVAIGLIATTAPNAPPAHAPASAANRPATGLAQPVGITLVAFDGPVFPLGFRPAPAGTRAPVFGGVFSNGQPELVAANYAGSDINVSVALSVSTTPLDRTGSGTTRATTFEGKPAVLFTDQSIVALSWLRKPGQWVTVSTLNGGANEARTRQLAKTVVEAPHRIAVHVHLAPAGFVLAQIRGDHTILLQDSRSNDEHRNISVELLPRLTRDLNALLNFSAPIRKVTMNGRPGQLAHDNNYTWVLEGTLADWSAFRLWAPQAVLTESQVIAIGAQVTRD